MKKSENKMAEYVQKYGFRVVPKADNQVHPPKDEYIIGVDLASGKDFTVKGGTVK